MKNVNVKKVAPGCLTNAVDVWKKKLWVRNKSVAACLRKNANVKKVAPGCLTNAVDVWKKNYMMRI